MSIRFELERAVRVAAEQAEAEFMAAPATHGEVLRSLECVNQVWTSEGPFSLQQVIDKLTRRIAELENKVKESK